MPYVIQSTCNATSGTEAKCAAACPFDCIHPNETAAPTEPLFYIDPEECTNCGACALACPESAITPASEFGYYAPPIVRPAGAFAGAALCVAPSEPQETSTFHVIGDEWITTYVASQP